MSGAESPPPGGRSAADLAAVGAIASSVAPELVRPLRDLRGELASVIDELDSHLTESTGPDPYPWDSTRSLRERLAEAYFRSREVTRLASHLAEAIGAGPALSQAVDVEECVESALSLSRGHCAAETEVFVDYGHTGAVRTSGGKLVLTLAQLILACADSARGIRGAAIAIHTRSEGEPGEPESVVISISDSGSGDPERARAAEVWARELAEEAGGSLGATAEPEKGTAFELRLPRVS